MSEKGGMQSKCISKLLAVLNAKPSLYPNIVTSARILLVKIICMVPRPKSPPNKYWLTRMKSCDFLLDVVS